jgi:zinc/manganese transport system substrate-binding protein
MAGSILIPESLRACSRRQWLQGGAGLLASAAWPVSAEPAPLRVVASFTILADLVREVGGPLVQVTSLVGPNGDAHVFEPRPADLKNVAAAELLVLNGLQFDRWAERLMRAAEFRGRLLVASDGITVRRNGLNIDPHAWHDLRLLQTYVTNIADALVALRPAAAAEFRRRASDYRQRLAALDQEIRAMLQPIPAERRRIMTTHDAFGYLGAAYGIEFLAPQGWSTESEPSAAQVANLIRQLRQHQVSALFLENISNPRLIERIAAEGGAKVGGTLYSDALSVPGGAVDSVLKLARHNAVTLAAGMQR